MSLQVDLALERGDFRLSVNGALPERGVTILFGVSGAGKSSLLKAIAGLQPCRGLIRFDDRVWQDEHQALPAHRRPVGLMLQRPTLFPHLDVAGNLRFAARRSGATNGRWREVVALTELQPLMERGVAGLSGGEAQRVALARALLTEPDLLMLDEPLSALDAERRQALMAVIARVGERLPVLYVTHQLDEVMTLGDHLWWLDRGGLREQGPLAECLAGLHGPLAAGGQAAVVLRTRHRGYDERHHLLELTLGDAVLRLPAAGPRGDTPRLKVAARDVSLALSPVRDSSVLNILPATVDALRDLGHGQCLVRLRCADQWLLARVSTLSRDRLGLRPGLALHAQIKAAALV